MLVAGACLAWLIGWCLAASGGSVLAASSPVATPVPVAPYASPGTDAGGDTRTPGQGPGLVGSPLYAIGGVLLVALLSVGLTQLYLRATPEPGAPDRAPGEPPGRGGGPSPLR